MTSVSQAVPQYLLGKVAAGVGDRAKETYQRVVEGER